MLQRAEKKKAWQPIYPKPRKQKNATQNSLLHLATLIHKFLQVLRILIKNPVVPPQKKQKNKEKIKMNLRTEDAS